MDVSFSEGVTRDAACLAHDQNNLLQVAVLTLTALEEEMTWEPTVHLKLHRLRRLLDDMASLNATALETYCASSVGASLDPAVVIRRTVEDMRDLNKSVVIGLSSLPENANVPIHPAHFQQVLFNVLKNALEAVPPKEGHITVNACFNTRELLDPRAGTRKSLCITVDDNGPGISPDQQQRLGRGRITTKSNGHGLGLSNSRKILDIYGGTLRFESKPTPGVRAHIIWPV